MRLYISRHVIFYETIFPFSLHSSSDSASSTPFSNPLSLLLLPTHTSLPVMVNGNTPTVNSNVGSPVIVDYVATDNNNCHVARDAPFCDSAELPAVIEHVPTLAYVIGSLHHYLLMLAVVY